MLPNAILKQLVLSVATELASAKNSQRSSLQYIHNPLPTRSEQNENELLQVLVVGGSIGKHAIFQYKNGSIHLKDKKTISLPLFKTKTDFLEYCSLHIIPEINKVAVNFAYPLMPKVRGNVLDGVLMQGMKEHNFDGLVGSLVGETLENHLFLKHKRRYTVSIANDTICLLLSGLSVTKEEELVAGVIGTGINFAFFDSPTDAINTEAANFSGFTPREEVRLIDKKSSSPGTALFEKETAGKYLYQQYNEFLKKESLALPMIQSSEELDHIAKKNSREGEIARTLLTHSAMYTAAMIAGIVTFKNHKSTLILEGSLFWKGYSYKETVEQTLLQLLPNTEITIIKVEGSSLLGAARLL